MSRFPHSKYREFVTSTWVSVRKLLEEIGYTQMALLGKQEIFSAQDIQYEDVSVPEWGGEVRVKGLSGRERDKFEADSLKKGKGGTRDVNLENLRARLIIMCAVDEQFQPIFDRSDIMRLGEKSASALEKVFSVAQRLSGMSDEDVDELAGNSDGDQSGDSTSS